MAGKGARRRPTMRDIADELGVSQQLVSLVFRGKPGASDEMREKVFETARRIGYVRDESARALRSQEPTSIGITFRTHQPFHDELLDALYRAAADTPHNLVLSAVSDSRDEFAAIEDLLSHRCGSIVAIGSRISDEDLSTHARGLPCLVVARRAESPDVDWVSSDDAEAMNEVVGHLADLGHTDIAYLSSEVDAGARDRLAAFVRAAGARGLTDSVRVRSAGITETGGAEATRLLMDEGPLPTAIIGFNDRCALGVMEILSRNGIRVPDEVSIVGFDDSEIASRPSTDITSVHQDSDALAQFAVRRAIQRMTDTVAPWEQRGLILPTRLVVRSSTGPAFRSAK